VAGTIFQRLAAIWACIERWAGINTLRVLDQGAALGTLAQLGVAIPGFAAIISLLRHRESPLSPSERISFLLMLTLASIVVIGSLLPFALSPLIGEDSTWRLCSVVLGLALGFFAVNTGRLAVRTRGTDAAPRRPKLLWWTGIGPFLLIAVLLCVSSFRASPGIYTAGLVVSVCGAGYLFWFSVLAAQRVVAGEPTLERPE
jgi:hypothetical protein